MPDNAESRKSSSVKVQTAVYLEPKQAEALRELSKITGVPQQVYLRRGIARILDENLGLIGHLLG